MSDWKLIFPAMKPERVLLAHSLFWLGLLTFSPDISHDMVRKIVMTLMFFLFYGGIYMLNDIADYQEDSADRHNKGRLIAAGRLSMRTAIIASFVLISIALLYASVFFGKVLVGELLALLVINALYSPIMKKIPYVDIVWISSTQWIKFIVASTIARDGLSLDWSVYGALMIAFWLGAISMHTEKQRGRMLQGRKRIFWFGGYNDRVMVWIQRISYVLIIILSIIYWKHPLFPLLSVVGGIILTLRVIFPHLTKDGFVEAMEERFKPR